MTETSCRRTTSWTCPMLVQSRCSNGPSADRDDGIRISVEITLPVPYWARSAGTNSEPSCPRAPVTRIIDIRRTRRLVWIVAQSYDRGYPTVCANVTNSPSGDWSVRPSFSWLTAPRNTVASPFRRALRVHILAYEASIDRAVKARLLGGYVDRALTVRDVNQVERRRCGEILQPRVRADVAWQVARQAMVLRPVSIVGNSSPADASGGAPAVSTTLDLHQCLLQ